MFLPPCSTMPAIAPTEIRCRLYGARRTQRCCQPAGFFPCNEAAPYLAGACHDNVRASELRSASQEPRLRNIQTCVRRQCSKRGSFRCCPTKQSHRLQTGPQHENAARTREARAAGAAVHEEFATARLHNESSVPASK